MSFTVTYQIKDSFFDRAKVRALMDEKTYWALYRMGANIRQRARKSMKLRGQARGAVKTERMRAKQLREIADTPPSPPGTPPHAHSADPVRTLRNILYGSSGPQSMVIGPVLLNRRAARSVMPQVTVPELHEFGGTATILEKRVGQRWLPLGGRARPGQPVRRRQAKYPARPYMAPALEKERGKFPELWASTIRPAA